MNPLQILTETDFSVYCSKNICNRFTMTTSNCLKYSKQQRCYKKYLIKIQKDTKKKELRDIKVQLWEDVCREVDYRDKLCIIWYKVLTEEEKIYIKENFWEDFNHYKNKVLGHCHIVPRKRSSKLFYDKDNIFLASWFFHKRFDFYKDLVTGEKMTKEDRDRWIERIRGKMI